jgi:hypothetical protein
MSLVPIDPTNAVAVTDYLTKARDWLATAVENTGPEQIAAAKAEIATASEATKQLGLSKEIQHDAAEMVRRAEWTLRKATKKAQESGAVRSRETNLQHNPRSVGTSTSPLPSPRDFFATEVEYRDSLAMGELEAAEFEEVLAEAKAEGNLSRANVAAKAREKAGAAPRTTHRRALPDQFFDAAYDLTKVTERIDRLVQDDRFPQNAEKVGAKHRADLLRAVELLTRALDNFPTN